MQMQMLHLIQMQMPFCQERIQIQMQMFWGRTQVQMQMFRVEEQHKVRNPYRWLAWKEERERKDRKRMGERHVQSPCQVRQVADLMNETIKLPY